MNKTIVRVIPDETVTIPRAEYNELIAAKHERDMILAAADPSGYGCAEIVKGARLLNSYQNALTASEAHIEELKKKHDETLTEYHGKVSDLEAKLKEALKAEFTKVDPEDPKC